MLASSPPDKLGRYMTVDVVDSEPEFLPLGVDGILVRFARVLSEDANSRALAFRDAVKEAALTGVTQIDPALTSVRVAFDPSQATRTGMAKALRQVAADCIDTAPSPQRKWLIPVAFGGEFGPQLTEVAKLVGITPDEAISCITGQVFRVIAIGFAPGQPYLGMLPDQWDIPRQSELTKSLPRGALISAVRQLVIWGADAPTGWRHVGQTAFDVYRPEAALRFAFDPGDLAQFSHVPDNEMADLRQNARPDGGARCEVLR